MKMLSKSSTLVLICFATCILLSEVQASTKCPCHTPDMCKRIIDTDRKEVFAFSVVNNETHWDKFDWAKLTTVVMTGYISDKLMCTAHALNTRVSYIAHIGFDFRNPTLRKQWIQKQITLIQDHFLDGINFDYENLVAFDDKSTRDAYTSLVAETYSSLKSILPHTQVSVDVAWKPNVDQRYYDYKGLAKNSDFLFVMAYDEQSQIFGDCVAMPNSGLGHTTLGLGDYISAGIPNDKLVLGLPWYGYIYPCVKLVGNQCYLKHVPFRGVNCSDAAGKQYGYGYIASLFDVATVNWNETSYTPYMTYSDHGKFHQVQFDNPKSLTAKYKIAETLKLRGVGMWNIDTLNYDDSDIGRKNRKEMFDALPTF